MRDLLSRVYSLNVDFPTKGGHSVKGVQSPWEVQQCHAADVPTLLSSRPKPSSSSLSGGYSVAEAARSLGLNRNLIRNWKQAREEQGEHAFPGHGRASSPFEEENRRLRAENKRLQAERDVLKKATAFFAREATWPTASSTGTKANGPSAFSARR
jgi:transposase